MLPPPRPPQKRQAGKDWAGLCSLARPSLYLQGILGTEITAHIVPRSSQATALTPRPGDRPHLRPGSGHSVQCLRGPVQGPRVCHRGSGNPGYFSCFNALTSTGRAKTLLQSQGLGEQRRRFPLPEGSVWSPRQLCVLHSSAGQRGGSCLPEDPST